MTGVGSPAVRRCVESYRRVADPVAERLAASVDYDSDSNDVERDTADEETIDEEPLDTERAELPELLGDALKGSLWARQIACDADISPWALGSRPALPLMPWPTNWKAIVRSWVSGDDVAKIGPQNMRAVEEAFTYRLVWALEAVLTRRISLGWSPMLVTGRHPINRTGHPPLGEKVAYQPFFIQPIQAESPNASGCLFEIRTKSVTLPHSM
ncbi:hypothetical protein [Marinobacter sp.]|uniref:hypothetical protein n=1 Tax=Marinobacter sp. TaxID=50741 RepID=UPI003F9CEDFF